MNLKNPIDAISAAAGYDIILERIRDRLFDQLPWLTRAFGRAFLLPEVVGEETLSIPKVFDGESDYMSVMPNDDIGQAFSFIIGLGEDTPSDREEGDLSYWFVKPSAIIFFLNLKELDPSKQYYYIENLKVDVLRVLTTFRQINVTSVVSESVADVYAGFDISEVSRDLFMYPHAGIRVNCDIKWALDC